MTLFRRRKRKRKAYEVIGGPMDGRRVPLMPKGWSQSFGWPERSEEGSVFHYYRLCVCVMLTPPPDREKFRARFWHYIGTSPDLSKAPNLEPPRRLFKKIKEN